MPVTLEQIEDAETSIGFMKERFLRQNGWEQTCKNPPCLWMWCKEIKGVKTMLGTSDAIRFQREL